QKLMDDIYAEFVQLIVDGRDMSESKVRELGDGRVYTGQQAADSGLVDGLGTLEDTTAMMKKDFEWPNAQVVKYQGGYAWESFLGGQVKSMFNNEDQNLIAIQDLLQQTDGPRAMYLYSK